MEKINWSALAALIGCYLSVSAVLLIGSRWGMQRELLTIWLAISGMVRLCLEIACVAWLSREIPEHRSRKKKTRKENLE